MTTTDTTMALQLADQLVTFLESGEAPDGLFAPDVFTDLNLPKWRVQAQGVEASTELRRTGHPYKSTVPRTRLDVTATGLVLEFEEEWEADGTTWSCREILRAEITGGSISEVVVYCTGDWDDALRKQHRDVVQLIRP